MKFAKNRAVQKQFEKGWNNGGNKSICVFEDSSFSSYGGGQVVTEVILNNLIAKGL